MARGSNDNQTGGQAPPPGDTPADGTPAPGEAQDPAAAAEAKAQARHEELLEAIRDTNTPSVPAASNSTFASRRAGRKVETKAARY